MGVSNVTAAKPKVGGAVYRAPYGTTLPTDATTSLNGSFVALGYITEDGLTNSNTMTTEDIEAWGGDVVLNVQTSKPDKFSFTLMEVLDTNVLSAIYGSANVSGSLGTGISVSASADEQETASWVVEMVMRNNVLKRIVIPQASISELEDIVYADDSAVGYGLTLTAYPDATYKTHYEYIKASASV